MSLRLLLDFTTRGSTWQCRSAFSARCPPPLVLPVAQCMVVVTFGRARRTRGKEINTRVEDQRCSWPSSSGGGTRCHDSSAIPALPLWRANRSTTKPYPCIVLAALILRNRWHRRNDLVVKTVYAASQSLRLRLS